ncbi:MAG: fibronectin type III domain-containing protein [Gemmatimonadetes bacterium]|nr:fibronectin type III domain-containing protein [Gemmatimonadota bacterium]
MFAANLAGNSASPSNSALANTRSPGVPASFAASVVSATRVDLSWSDTTAAETGFAIERCVGTNCAVFSALATVAAAATAYSDHTVVVDSSYRYRVRATGVAGNSAEAGPVLASLILPNAPSGLAAATVSGTQVNLTWTDASDNESSFRIERCAGAGCSTFVEVGSAAAGTPSYSDVGVTAGNDYQYRIRARNAVGNSGASNTAAASTRAATAPTALTARRSLRAPRIDLAWTDQSDNETDFRIERCTGVGCSNFTTLATVAAGVVTYQNTGVTAGLSYSYRVLAINAVGASAASNTATATTAVPSAPTGLSATLFSDSRIDLAWTDASSDEQGFVLERCEGAGCVNFAAVGAALAAGVISYQDTDVAPGLDYRYRVRAFNVVGSSAFSSVVATSTRPPTAPTGLNAITVSGTRIDLNWTDAADNESGFVIERCSGAGCSTFTQLATPPANVTSYQDLSAPLDLSYTYRIRAVNNAGPSGDSNDATAGTILPVAPSALAATVVSAGRIDLTWADNALDANGFVVERCPARLRDLRGPRLDLARADRPLRPHRVGGEQLHVSGPRSQHLRPFGAVAQR